MQIGRLGGGGRESVHIPILFISLVCGELRVSGGTEGDSREGESGLRDEMFPVLSACPHVRSFNFLAKVIDFKL